MEDRSKSSIRNTTQEMRENTGEQLLAVFGGAEYIHEQERAGQAQVVNSDRLPTKLNDWPNEGDGPYLALGFTFGPADPGDSLFRPATLPSGWTRRRTDHSMWTEVVDTLGRKRVSIFYKAAFYDRDAFMSLETPTGYLRSCLWNGAAPVLDEEWLTVDVARQTLEAIAVAEDKHAVEAAEFAATSSGERGEYWRGREADQRAGAAKARALAESLGALPDGGELS